MNCSRKYVIHINRNMGDLERDSGQTGEQKRNVIDIRTKIRSCRAAILDREQKGMPLSSDLALALSDLVGQLKTLQLEIKYLNRVIPT